MLDDLLRIVDEIFADHDRLAVMHRNAWLDLTKQPRSGFQYAYADARRQLRSEDGAFIRGKLSELIDAYLPGSSEPILEPMNKHEVRRLQHLIPYFSIKAVRGNEHFGYKRSKPRLVWNCSVSGLNDRVLPASPETKLVYRSAAELCSIMRKDTLLAGMDLSSAYHCMVLPKHVRNYFGIAVPLEKGASNDESGGFQHYRASRYFFGLATSSHGMQVTSYKQIRDFGRRNTVLTVERW